MEEVLRENLIPGKEYYLQCVEESCVHPSNPYKMIAKFKCLEPSAIDFMWACFSNFRKIENKNFKTVGYNVELNGSWRFYEIAKHRVQKNMESRAYNMVLLYLIGDEYFRPIDVI